MKDFLYGLKYVVLLVGAVAIVQWFLERRDQAKTS